jgi:hypothetical protein
LLCVFVAVSTFLLSPCLAKVEGCTYRQTDWWEGFMKYAAETSSGAMTYIPSFINMCSGIEKLMGGGDTETYWHKSALSFSK